LSIDWGLVITIIGTLFGLVSIVIAIFQTNEKKRLQNLIRTKNWFNYERANVTNGLTQETVRLYKSRHMNNIDADVLENISKIDAFGQEIYMSSIDQIQIFEPSFNRDDFEKWRQEGKITDDKYKLFMKFTVDNKISKKALN
jgi:hypothetical protein